MKLSIRSHADLFEQRAHEQITEDPSILGLGDPDSTRLQEDETKSDTNSAIKLSEACSTPRAVLKQVKKWK